VPFPYSKISIVLAQIRRRQCRFPTSKYRLYSRKFGHGNAVSLLQNIDCIRANSDTAMPFPYSKISIVFAQIRTRQCRFPTPKYRLYSRKFGHGSAVSLLQNNRLHSCKFGYGSAVSLLQNNRLHSCKFGYGSAVSLQLIRVGKRHCRILNFGN
jgi:hypothetical protein